MGVHTREPWKVAEHSSESSLCLVKNHRPRMLGTQEAPAFWDEAGWRTTQ